jgi:hypothetical protein
VGGSDNDVLCQLEWQQQGARQAFKAVEFRAGGGFKTKISADSRQDLAYPNTRIVPATCYGNLQDESIRAVRSETAGATGGARDGSPDSPESFAWRRPRTFLVSLQDRQLLTKCQIFESDVSVTTEHENDKSNCDENCSQHEKRTVPSSDERINELGAQGVLANDRPRVVVDREKVRQLHG